MGEDSDASLAKRRFPRNQRTDSVNGSARGSNKRRLTMPMIYQMYESQNEDLRGTIYGPDSPDFRPTEASETLRKALSSMDTKDQVIVSVLLHHNNFQRQKILSAYEDMYGKKLVDDLAEETGGYFLEMTLAMFKPAHEYDTTNLYRSLSNRYADHSVAVEIACTRSARQLRVIHDTYLTNYKKTVDMDIVVKIEGTVGRMLTLLLCKAREEDGKKLNNDLVETHAELLIKNSFEKIAKNMELFEKIFIGHSWKHLTAVFERVDEIRNNERDLETLIRKNKVLHTEIRRIFLTIVRVARNMQLYFAEQLHYAIAAEKPDHQTIIRVTVTRSEIDLYDIAEEYKRKYQRTLIHDIQQICSGDYMRLVVALLTDSSNNNNNII